jgi:membrane-anchored mycosin MYCP
MVQEPEFSHQRDQLIVDLQHLPVVEAELKRLGIAYTADPSDQDDGLELALLRDLTDFTGATLDLAFLMALLGQRFAAERDGWVPLMDVNHYVDTVVGKTDWVGTVVDLGHKPMAEAEPEPATENDLPIGEPVSEQAGRGVRVALVDTNPPPAAGPGDGPVSVHAGHSMFVQSLIHREAPAATIHLNGALGGSTGRANSWDTARAMMQVAFDHQVDILNLSLGTYSPAGPPLVIRRAIERLTPHVLVVAAAGNHGAFTLLAKGRTRQSAIWPGAQPQAIAVGAHDNFGSPADFSPNLPWVTCTALGVQVVGTYVDAEVTLSTGPTRFQGFARWSGTSFSTATVSGAVAARTIPGTTTARQAFDDLRDEGKVVRAFAATP